MVETILDSFCRVAAEAPVRPAFIQGDQQLSYAQLSELSSRVASGLAKAGVGRGMPVGVFAKEAINFPVACLALWRLGAIIVPFDPGAPAEDRAVRESIAELPFMISDTVLSPARPATRVLPFAKLAGAAPFPLPAPPLPEDDSLFVFTSGTTGQPKVLIHSHASLYRIALRNVTVGNVVRDDVVLATIPLQLAIGIYNLVFAPLLAGATVVLIQPFSARLALSAAIRHSVSSIPTVPAIARLLAGLPDSLGRPQLRNIYTGAATIDAAAYKIVRERFGIAPNRGYGMSEVGQIAGTCGRGEMDYRPTVGWPCIELRLLDDKGREVPQGEAGEVAVRTDSLCRPYCLVQGGGREPLPMRGEFFLTGDIGRLEPDGALMLVGRKKEFINGPRLRVNPHEVEAVILQMPGVKDTAVVPAPGRHGYESIHAFVAADSDVGMNEAAIATFCALHLPAGKRPQIIDFIDAIPRNAAGKVMRWRLPPAK